MPKKNCPIARPASMIGMPAIMYRKYIVWSASSLALAAFPPHPAMRRPSPANSLGPTAPTGMTSPPSSTARYSPCQPYCPHRRFLPAPRFCETNVLTTDSTPITRLAGRNDRMAETNCAPRASGPASRATISPSTNCMTVVPIMPAATGRAMPSTSPTPHIGLSSVNRFTSACKNPGHIGLSSVNRFTSACKNPGGCRLPGSGFAVRESERALAADSKDNTDADYRGSPFHCSL